MKELEYKKKIEVSDEIGSIIHILKHSSRPLTTKEILMIVDNKSERNLYRELNTLAKCEIIKKVRFKTIGYKFNK